MNIANIFGLHIGCRARCEDSCCENVGEIIQLKQKWVRIQYAEYNEGRWFEIKDCKLILKPLSKITDEDKAEFHKTFASNKQSIKHIGIEEGGVVFATFIDSTGNPNYVDLGIIPTLWLASKGYDIGLVPDEYKEVEE